MYTGKKWETEENKKIQENARNERDNAKDREKKH